MLSECSPSEDRAVWYPQGVHYQVQNTISTPSFTLALPFARMPFLPSITPSEPGPHLCLLLFPYFSVKRTLTLCSKPSELIMLTSE